MKRPTLPNFRDLADIFTWPRAVAGAAATVGALVVIRRVTRRISRYRRQTAEFKESR